MKISGIIIIAAFVLISNLSAQNVDKRSRKKLKLEKKEAREKEVVKIIHDKNFIFSARHANPLSGSSRSLISDYDLVIKNDSAFAYLPYFGVAYHAEYMGTDGGIKFKESLREYQMNTKKEMYTIEFSIDSPKDHYICILSISKSGYATLDISSNKRQAINFNGIIESPER